MFTALRGVFGGGFADFTLSRGLSSIESRFSVVDFSKLGPVAPGRDHAEAAGAGSAGRARRRSRGCSPAKGLDGPKTQRFERTALGLSPFFVPPG